LGSGKIGTALCYVFCFSGYAWGAGRAVSRRGDMAHSDVAPGGHGFVRAGAAPVGRSHNMYPRGISRYARAGAALFVGDSVHSNRWGPSRLGRLRSSGPGCGLSGPRGARLGAPRIGRRYKRAAGAGRGDIRWDLPEVGDLPRNDLGPILGRVRARLRDSHRKSRAWENAGPCWDHAGRRPGFEGRAADFPRFEL